MVFPASAEKGLNSLTMVQDMPERALQEGLLPAWQGSRHAMRGTSRRSVAPDTSGKRGLNRFTVAQNRFKRAPGRMVAVLRMTAEAGSQCFQTALRRA